MAELERDEALSGTRVQYSSSKSSSYCSLCEAQLQKPAETQRLQRFWPLHHLSYRLVASNFEFQRPYTSVW